MRIFRWWKTIEILPGVTFDVCRGEITSEQAMFTVVVAAIMDETDMDYVLLERREEAVAYRNQEAK